MPCLFPARLWAPFVGAALLCQAAFAQSPTLVSAVFQDASGDDVFQPAEFGELQVTLQNNTPLACSSTTLVAASETPVLELLSTCTLVAPLAPGEQRTIGFPWLIDSSAPCGSPLAASVTLSYGEPPYEARLWTANPPIGRPEGVSSTISADVHAPIPDATLTGTSSTVTLDLDDAQEQILSASLQVDITHPWRGDLRLALIVPGGGELPVFDGYVADGTPSFPQVFDISQLRGNLAAGNYTLRVIDKEAGDVGTLNSWSLNILHGYYNCSPEAGLDAWDPADDQPQQATLLDLPTSVPLSHGRHILSQADAEDWFAIPMLAGRCYKLSSRHFFGSTQAALFEDALSASPAAEDANAELRPGFSILYRPTQSRTCYLRVRACSSPGAAYDLLASHSGFEPSIDDTLDTATIEPGGAASGWSVLGFNTPGLAQPDYDSTHGALLARVYGIAEDQPGRFRLTGLFTNQSEWLPYAAVGADNYVRAKFYVYATGQEQSASNQIPNIRLRISTRFAVNSMLEVLHHDSRDVQGSLYGAEIRPSSDPAHPSLYRVDLDPVDVPYLASNARYEGIMRGFEAYSTERQDNGCIALAESVIGVYPAEALSDSLALEGQTRIYATSASDAGDLKVMNSASELSVRTLALPAEEGGYAQPDTSATLPSYFEGPAGITFDATQVASDRVGVVSRELAPEAQLASRLRVEEGKQYKIRFHVTSTQQAVSNAQLRLRARALKFAWTQKYEVGGAWATGLWDLTPNNAIAQQALPGIGCMNPDRSGFEQAQNGGWYTVLFHSPMSKDIRPEFDAQADLAQRMPATCSQPSAGVDQPSVRDLRLGIDLLDTLSRAASAPLEKGNFTVDRVEVRGYNLVDD